MMAGASLRLFRVKIPALAAGVAGLVTGLVMSAAVPDPAAAAAAAGAPAPVPARARFAVTSLASSGPGSLRSAIAAAGARRSGGSAITFAVTGTIRLASQLPPVTGNVIIDGTTAPGYLAGGPPRVAVDFAGRPGLQFAAGSAGSALLALALEHAAGAGVTLLAGGITLNLNYIGLTPGGGAAGNSGDGVYVAASSRGDQIGLNPGQVSGTVGNVISANSGNGITLAGSAGLKIEANRIGTTPGGGKPLGNGGSGIRVTDGARGTLIGGMVYIDSATGQANNPTGSKGTVPPVFVVPPLGNQISGNGGDGILIDHGSAGNLLSGNFIGTTANGDGRLGNRGDGVAIDGSAGNALLGCQVVNNPFVYYNVISGNGGDGLRVTNSAGTLVERNFFGIGANNTAVIGNRLDGILVDGSSAGTLVGGVIPLGNVAAGNGRNGIEVAGKARGFITFNTFGGLLAFKGAAPNGNDGLLVTSTGGDIDARTNVFSGNRNNGIVIAGQAHDNHVFGAFVGTEVLGVKAIGNRLGGILIAGTAYANVIGGPPSPSDLISGNGGFGVILGPGTSRNKVLYNFIGLNRFGGGLRNAIGPYLDLGVRNLAEGNRFGV